MSIIYTFIFFIQALDIKFNVSFQNIIIKIVFLARLLILIKKGGLLQLKFGVVGVGVSVGVNIYLWAR